MPPGKQSIVLFDGYCNLCSWSVRFISKRDKKKIFSFIPLQSAEALKIPGLLLNDSVSLASVILFEDGRIYKKSTAALRIARSLRFPWNLFYGFIIIPAFLRDGIYMVISRNRYKLFGKRKTCNLIK